MLRGSRVSKLVFVHYPDGPIGLASQEHWILLSFNSLDYFLGFRSHFVGMLNLGLKSLNNRQNIVRLTNRYVYLIIGCFPSSQLVFLRKNKRLNYNLQGRIL